MSLVLFIVQLNRIDIIKIVNISWDMVVHNIKSRLSLFICCVVVNWYVAAQFPEGFEANTFPPEGWATYRGVNGEGEGRDWIAITNTPEEPNAVANGNGAAYIQFDSPLTEDSVEDWLVTPLFLASDTSVLVFNQRQKHDGDDRGSVYTIRVSEASQTAYQDFQIVDTQTENDFTNAYTSHHVDLSAYSGKLIYVAFVMENSNGDDWYIDDVTVVGNQSPPNCSMVPTPETMATDIVLDPLDNSITLTWTPDFLGDTAMEYQFYLGTSELSLAAMATTVAPSIYLSNLEYSTTYYWQVVPTNTAGSATNCPIWQFATGVQSQAPSNDTCEQATLLLPGFDCNAVLGDTTLATPSEQLPLENCGGSIANDDVWFKFTAAAENYDVDIEFLDGDQTIVIELFDGCNAENSIACIVNPRPVRLYELPSTTIGQEYYLRIHSFTSWVGGSVFNICIVPREPPENDECANAIVLLPSSDDTCSNSNVASGDTEYATDSGRAVCGDIALPGTPDDDIWYRFTATSVDHDIVITNANGTTDIVAQVYEDSCSGNSILCQDEPNSPIELRGLTVGNDYVFRVYSWSSFNRTAFDICIITPIPTPGPENDECVSAIPLEITTNADCVPVVGTTLNATDSLVDECGDTTGTSDDDIWYRFIATNTAVDIQINNIDGSDDIVVEVFEASCNGTLIACDDSDALVMLTALNEGSEYFFRVYSWSASERTSFEVCLVTPQRNDEREDATALLPSDDETCNSILGTTVAATQSLPGCIGVADDDIWYSFVASSSTHTINIEHIEGNSDIVTQLFDANNVDMLCQDAPNTPVELSNLVVGDTYYFRVYTFTDIADAFTTFNICLTTPSSVPVNDLCTNAISIACNQIIEGTTFSATGAVFAHPCEGSRGDDVWYQFEGDGNITELIVTSGANAQIGVYESNDGTCEGFLEPEQQCLITAESFDNTVSVSFSTETNKTYYVNVGARVGTGAAFDFTLARNCSISNDECQDAHLLTLGEDVLGDTTDATDSGMPAGICSTTGGDKDVWYRFIAPQSGAIVVETTADYVVIYASCNGEELGCVGDGEEVTGLSTNGTSVYYARVYHSGVADRTLPGPFTLKIMDKATLSNTDFNSIASLLYHPNPVLNTLEIQGNETINAIEVYNMLGQKVLQHMPNTLDTKLDMTALKSGIYFITLTMLENQQTIRIVKD